MTQESASQHSSPPPVRIPAPEIVTVRDVYMQGSQTKDQVTALTVEVRTLCEKMTDDRKEFRKLRGRVRKTELKVYGFTTVIVAFSFVVSNWQNLGMMSG